ncbi:MAG: ABC transporter substrate-binding protein [Planctomycetia bacterium]|nr:ABC transporter substrate-binding protein [Planctomycetia bacterium]
MKKIPLFFLLIFALPLCLQAADPPVLRMKMLWLPQAEFAGFYRALEDGLYEQAGVHLLLEHPRPEEDVFDTLQKEETDIIVAWPIPALQRMEAGEDLVNIGQIAQNSALMFIARKSSGILQPGDISGHRVGLYVAPSLQAPFRSFLDYHGVENCKFLPILTNVDLFLYKGVDITAGVYYDEYYRIYGAGIDPDQLVCFELQNVFSELVDDGLYTLRKTWTKYPDLCKKIRSATLEGWRRVFADPKRGLELVRKYCEKDGVFFDIAHQRWMLSQMKNLIFPEGRENSGILSRASFDELMIMLAFPEGKIVYERFVPEMQKGGRP